MPDGLSPVVREAHEHAERLREHYTVVCHCEWSENEFTRETTSDGCMLHGCVSDPLPDLLSLVERLDADVSRLERELAKPRKLADLEQRALDESDRYARERDEARAEADRLREVPRQILAMVEDWERADPEHPWDVVSSFWTAVSVAREALRGEGE